MAEACTAWFMPEEAESHFCTTGLCRLRYAWPEVAQQTHRFVYTTRKPRSGDFETLLVSGDRIEAKRIGGLWFDLPGPVLDIMEGLIPPSEKIETVYMWIELARGETDG